MLKSTKNHRDLRTRTGIGPNVYVCVWSVNGKTFAKNFYSHHTIIIIIIVVNDGRYQCNSVSFRRNARAFSWHRRITSAGKSIGKQPCGCGVVENFGFRANESSSWRIAYDDDDILSTEVDTFGVVFSCNTISSAIKKKKVEKVRRNAENSIPILSYLPRCLIPNPHRPLSQRRATLYVVEYSVYACMEWERWPSRTASTIYFM